MSAPYLLLNNVSTTSSQPTTKYQGIAMDKRLTSFRCIILKQKQANRYPTSLTSSNIKILKSVYQLIFLNTKL